MAAGDHIRVKRALGAYYHHGIDMGDGTVVHFEGEPLQQQDVRVTRVDLDEFLKGGVPEVVEYPSDISTYAPKETLERAAEMVGRKGYRLFSNNCEHFATYCKSGKPYSTQVRRFVKAAGMLMVAGTGAVSAFIIKKTLEKRGMRTRA